MTIELPKSINDLPDTIEHYSDVIACLKKAGHSALAGKLLTQKKTVLTFITAFSQQAPPLLAFATTPSEHLRPEQNMRHLLTCPLGKHLFQDPVTTPWGYTFDRTTYENLWQRIYPEQTIPEDWLVPNMVIKQIVSDFVECKQVEDIDLSGYLIDPLSEVPMDSDMVLDTLGHTYSEVTLKAWLTKSPNCPMSYEKSCRVEAIRPNRLLKAISHQFQVAADTPDCLACLYDIADNLPESNDRDLLIDCLNSMTYLSAPKDETDYIRALETVITQLKNLCDILTGTHYYLSFCRAGVEKAALFDCLFFIQKQLVDAITINRDLTRLHWQDKRSTYLEKLRLFHDLISYKQKCSDRADSLVFANVNLNVGAKILFNAILRNEEVDGHRYYIVLEAQKRHQAFTENVAKIIAGNQIPLIYAYDNKVNIQFKFETSQLDRSFFAFHYLKLMNDHDIASLSHSEPGCHKPLNELSTRPEYQKMIQRLEKLMTPPKKLPWLPWRWFSNHPAPASEVREKTSPELASKTRLS